MDSKTEPASEKEQAIWMANNLLDEPNADPDDDVRTISRQFLRALEEITSLKAELERERENSIDICIKEIQSMIKISAFDEYKFSYQLVIENIERLKKQKLTMEKTDKFTGNREVHTPVLVERITKISNNYAAQQLSEYKEVIKELLPVAERMQQMCAYRGKGDSAYRDNGIEYKAIIDRAKKLIEK